MNGSLLLILQTVALMVAAYLLGAMVAGLLRRSLATTKPGAGETRTASMWLPKGAEPVAAGAASAARDSPAPASGDARRFERALTGVAGTPTPVRPAPPAPPPAATPAVAGTQSSPPSSTPASVQPAAAAPTSAAAASTVAAAAAAAAAVQRAAAPTPSAALPSAIFPSATGSSGPAMVSAQVRLGAEKSAGAQPADDLTKIRAIDAGLARRLVEQGITRFQQIADWRTGDVQRVADALSLKGRIQQENWIEQAQILARGGETAYAAGQPLAGAPLAAPTSDEGERKTLRVQAPSAPMPTRAGPAPAAVPAPAAAAGDGPSPRVQDRAAFAARPAASGPATAAAAPAATPVAASAAVAAAAAAAAVVVARAGAAAPALAPAAGVPAAPQPAQSAAPPPAVARPAPLSPPPVPPGPPAAAAAAVAAAAMRPAATVSPATAASPPRAAAPDSPIGSARDNLQRIRGVNAEVEKLLNVQGVTRFAQIASWSPSEVQRFDRLLGYEGRIARENWIEQAQILSRGNETPYSRVVEQGAPTPVQPGPAEPPRPARLAEAIKGSEARAEAAPPVSGPATRNDLSGLRSVRSEAYRGGDPGEASRRAGAGDDLKRIRGIGVLIEKKLNALSVTSYDQIANWSTGDIDKVSRVLDFKGRIERENWVEQARILASGGQTEFSRRVDRGDADSSRNKS